jgi:hypothetical protein
LDDQVELEHAVQRNDHLPRHYPTVCPGAGPRSRLASACTRLSSTGSASVKTRPPTHHWLTCKPKGAVRVHDYTTVNTICASHTHTLAHRPQPHMDMNTNMNTRIHLASRKPHAASRTPTTPTTAEWS